MNDRELGDGYQHDESTASHTASYVWSPVLQVLNGLQSKRVFDLGCGNGAFARFLTAQGFDVVGVDPSPSGIARAREASPGLKVFEGSAYEDLAASYGTFPAVVSLEVIEHVYAPRDFCATIFDLLEPGGTLVLSTPYHGYLKNLALAATGRLDGHFTALWDHGHIKFWSKKTLGQLLREMGFVGIQFARVGRVPPLAKSLIAIAGKPEQEGC